MNAHEWQQISARILSAWPSSRLKGEHLVEWYETLQRYPDTAIAAAVDRLIRTEEHAPSLARIVKALGRYETGTTPCSQCGKASDSFQHRCANPACQMLTHVVRVCDKCYLAESAPHA